MTNTLLGRLCGRLWNLSIGDGLTIQVRSVDARLRWTIHELLVTPEHGTGRTWVPLSALIEVGTPMQGAEDIDLDIPRADT